MFKRWVELSHLLPKRIHKFKTKLMMQTSIKNRNEAYVLNLKNMSEKRREVYALIHELGRATAQQVKERMKVGINQVSGRITELKETCFIVEVGSVKNNKSGTNNTVYRVATDEERKELINKRYKILVKKWIGLEKDFKQGYELGLSESTLEAIEKRLTQTKREVKRLRNSL